MKKCRITLLRFALPYVTFCGIHRNNVVGQGNVLSRDIRKQHGHGQEKY